MSYQFLQQAPPAGIDQILKRMYEAAEAVRMRNVPHFNQPRVAGLNPDLMRAAEMSRRSGIYDPLFNAAQRGLEDVNASSYPREHQRYMNPYNQGVVRNLENESMRTFNERILPSLSAQFTRLGQHGSLRHRQMAERAARDVQRDLADRRQEMLSQGFREGAQLHQAEKARGLIGAKELASLGAMKHAGHMTDIGMLENTGQYQHQMDQLRKDMDYQNYLHEMGRAPEGLNLQSSIMQGLPYQTQTGFYRAPEERRPSEGMGSRLAQLATNVYGARLAGGR